MLDTSKIGARTVNLADSRMINANLAKVIIATTGACSHDDVQEQINAKLDGQGSIVAGSLRKLKGDRIAATYVGFVRSVSEVKDVEPHEIQANYHTVLASNSNVLVDNADGSVWGLKSGPTGKYLVRQSDEDLSTLINASTVHSASNIRVGHIDMQVPGKKALVAYVTPEGNMDYGFVTKVSAQNGVVELVSRETGNTRVVNTQLMAGSYNVEIDKKAHTVAAASLDAKEKDKMVAFYKALYSFAPEYLDEVVAQIEAL